MTEVSREEALAHFGVKGMKWGVRKKSENTATSSSESKKRFSNKQKAAVGLGILAVGGAVVATIILGKQGKIPINDISRRLTTNQHSVIKNTPPHPTYYQTVNTGAKAAKQISSTEAFKKLLKDMESNLADAHKEETTWMRNNVPNYNPHLDPYIPRSELKRVNNK